MKELFKRKPRRCFMCVSHYCQDRMWRGRDMISNDNENKRAHLNVKIKDCSYRRELIERLKGV